MKKYLLIAMIFLSHQLLAQIPEDAARYSFFPQNGTARSLAIGGALGSLGGDINSIFVNPAGLGNYKTGEVVFTPGFLLNNNKSSFRDSTFKNTKNAFNIGTIGIVYGTPHSNNSKSSQAVSLAFTQIASYNNTVQYKGLNNYSSFSEQWAEQAAKSGKTIDQLLNDKTNAYGTSLGLYNFLVDTVRVNDSTVNIVAMPENVLAIGNALLQEKTIETKGGLYEFAIGYASNKNDKLLMGASLGIPILNYSNNTTFKETDTSSNKNNGFNYFTYQDNYKTTGAGLNVRLGLIYKPSASWRLGVALQSPTYLFSVTEKRTATLASDVEDRRGLQTVSSNIFNNNQQGEYKYSMLNPWRLMVSGSYVFREVENVKRQRGFITADIEYVNHRSGRFYSANERPADEELNYYKNLNKVVKGYYKGNFNFRLGGELKFNTIMVRAGAAYYTNPYKDAALKANRFLLSGGLGYRHKGFFIDLTYIHSFNKDVDFAYRLQDKANTFATIDTQRGNIVASVGVKF